MAEKYQAAFGREVSGCLQIVARRNFKPDQVRDGLSYKGRTHIIDLNEPAYRAGNTVVYLVDIDKGQKLVGKNAPAASPKLLDAILRKEIVKQLVSGLQGAGDWKLALIIGILCAAGGIMGGIVIGHFLGF